MRKNDAVKIPVSIATLLFCLSGCGRQPLNGALLASAGGKKLFMSEVAAHVDTNSAYAVRNYVSNWVDQQLLLGEAQKEGMDNNRQFRDRVDEFASQLAVTMLLNRRIYDLPVDFSQEAITNYYSTHREEFHAAENIALANYAAFDKRSAAVSFRNSLVSGKTWSEALGRVPPYELLAISDSAYLKGSGTNQAIWTVLQSLANGMVSFPVPVDSLSYVVKVIKWYGAGQPLPIDCVAADIKEKLTIEKRSLLYKNLVDSLRSAGNFEINPVVAIRDTGAQE